MPLFMDVHDGRPAGATGLRRIVAPAAAAVAVALVLSACGPGGESVGVNRSASASPTTPTQVSPAPGSNLQDMRDLYALKREVAAFRREQPPVSGGVC
jgi:hypothetical protein